MDKASLHQIQSWTKAVLIQRGDLAEKISNASAQFAVGIEALIQSKAGLTAHQRLDIYASGYVLRLLDCLYADYPCLKRFMGEELFDVFAKAYIVSLPSNSFSLFHFTARFPEYLASTRPRHLDADPQQKALFELPAEIALFERAKAEIAIAKGTENQLVNVPDIVDLLQEAYEFQTPACLRLLHQQYDMIGFLQELEADERPNIPIAKSCFVGLSRKNYRMQVQALTDWQYYFLEACAQTKSRSEATQYIVKLTHLKEEEITAKLLIWIPVAIELGFLLAIE